MVCMAMALCVSCKKDNAEPSGGGNGGGGGTQTVATVTTDEVTDITRTTAVCGGEVKSENGWAVTERGVCWGVEPNPTPSDNHTVDGEGVGKFISEITGLEPGTKYYVRAYAKNAAGTGFGEQKSFTTGGGGQTQTFTVNGVSFEMVAVNGGTFTMGATAEQGSDAFDNEKPTHSVTLSDYYIGKFEVTQELWLAVMGSWPGTAPNGNYGVGVDYPAYFVSWNDCQDFISRLNQLTGRNFRLPTEAEWEYAARGGSDSSGYKYSGSNSINDVAWYYDGNSGYKTHPVGTKSPNELGIYDMSGNVYEWCQDWGDIYSSSSQTNPQGPSSGSGRVNRGGSWNGNARHCRVSYRNFNTPGNRYDNFGFRLAVSQ